METPMYSDTLASSNIDLAAYLPSLTEIDNHVDIEGIYTEAELEQLDDDLGLGPRKKRKRSFGRRSRNTQLPPELAKKMGDANMMWMNHDLIQAVQILLEIIREAPHVPDPYHTLGLVYEQLGRRRDALQVFVLAAHFTPRDESIWRRLAAMATDLNEADQALHCLTRVIRMAPDDLDSLFRRSMIYKAEGDDKRAVDGFKLLVSRAPNHPQYLKEYSPLLFKQKRSDLAQQLLEGYMKAARVQLNADHNDAERLSIWDLTIVNMLCELYMQRALRDQHELFSKAQALLAETVSLRLTTSPLPPELTIRFGLCNICTSDDDHDERSRFDAMVDHIFQLDATEFADFYVEVGDILSYLEQLDKAVLVFGSLEIVDGFNNASLWIRLARCYKDLPDGDKQAIQYCQKMIKEHPDDPEPRVILSDVYRDQGDTDRAIAVLNDLGQAERDAVHPRRVDKRRAKLPIDACTITLLYQHAQICSTEGKFGEIVTNSYDKIAETLKTIIMRQHWRASVDEGKEKTRIRSIPSLLCQTNEFLPTATILCRSLIAVGRLDQASTLLKQLLSFDWPVRFVTLAQITDIRCMAADLFCHLNDDDRASLQVVQVILDTPEAAANSQLMYLLGVILFRLGYPDRLRRFLERVVARHPHCVAFRVALGHFATMKHFYRGACRQYLHAISIAPAPTNPSLILYAAIGLLHRSLGSSVTNRNFTQLRAFDLFFEYSRRVHRAPHALFNLARAFHSIGINHLAAHFYTQTIEECMRPRRPPGRAVTTPSITEFAFPLSSAETGAASELMMARNASFNLSLIYLASGSDDIAARVLHQHIVF